jgi:hypothetical protein
MLNYKPFHTLLLGAILGIILIGVFYWLDKLYENPNGLTDFIKTTFSSLAYLQLLLLGICWIFDLERYFGQKEMDTINWIIIGFSILFLLVIIDGSLNFSGALDSMQETSQIKNKADFLVKMLENKDWKWAVFCNFCLVMIPLLLVFPKIRKNKLWTVVICLFIISSYLLEWYLVLFPAYKAIKG